MYNLNLSDIASRLRKYKGRCLTLTLQCLDGQPQTKMILKLVLNHPNALISKVGLEKNSCLVNQRKVEV